MVVLVVANAPRLHSRGSPQHCCSGRWPSLPPSSLLWACSCLPGSPGGVCNQALLVCEKMALTRHLSWVPLCIVPHDDDCPDRWWPQLCTVTVTALGISNHSQGGGVDAILMVPRTVPIHQGWAGWCCWGVVALWAWDELGGGILRRALGHWNLGWWPRRGSWAVSWRRERKFKD